MNDTRIPQGRILVFPDLESLTTVARPSRDERVVARLVASYDAVIAQLGSTDCPHPAGVWSSLADEKRLIEWIARPMRRESAHRRLSAMSLFWFHRGPESSEHVSMGQIIITDRAYSDWSSR